MKKLLIAASVGMVVAALPADAQISWDYVGVGYVDAAGDGPYIEGSVKLAPAWVLQADYSRQTRGRFDFNVIDVGVVYLSGFKLDFSPQSQTFLKAGIDSYSGDADETGVYIGAGVKHSLSPQAELFTAASYHTIADNYGSLEGGIAYYLSPDWAVRSSLALNSGDTKNEFRFGVSYQF